MEQDYAKVLVEQKKIGRRLKIQSIENQMSEEKSKKKTNAILTGILAAGVIASAKLSGLDIKQALETEVQALTSLKALGSYFAMFTPVTYVTSAYAALCAVNYFKHNKKYNKLSNELYEAELEDRLMKEAEKDFESDDSTQIDVTKDSYYDNITFDSEDELSKGMSR